MPQPLGRQAPPVSFTSDGGVPWRGLQALLIAAGAGVFVHWLQQHGWLFWPLQTLLRGPWLGAAVAAITGLLAWRRLRRPPRTLAWTGSAWTLDGQPVGLQLRLDLQTWLLLRLQCGRQHQWLALTARQGPPAAWHGLRVALYSRAPTPPPSTPDGPPA
jgi:hypothetical protein